MLNFKKKIHKIHIYESIKDHSNQISMLLQTALFEKELQKYTSETFYQLVLYLILIVIHFICQLKAGDTLNHETEPSSDHGL